MTGAISVSPIARTSLMTVRDLFVERAEVWRRALAAEMGLERAIDALGDVYALAAEGWT